jgi:hypothetical protein
MAAHRRCTTWDAVAVLIAPEKYSQYQVDLAYRALRVRPAGRIRTPPGATRRSRLYGAFSRTGSRNYERMARGTEPTVRSQSSPPELNAVGVAVPGATEQD